MSESIAGRTASPTNGARGIRKGEGEKMEDNTALEVLNDAPAIADDRLIAVAEAAERRVEAMGKIKRMSLKMTNARDWTDQGGKPYLQVSGAEKIGRLFGISWRIDEPVYETEEGGHFGYTYKGYFTLGGATIEAIGTRSSKDKFFTKYKDGAELPLSAIDKGDIKKAAYTNLLGSGITRILGMRNLTWEELQEAGISQDQVGGRVDYKKDGKDKERIGSEGAASIETFITAVSMQAKKKDGTLMKSPLYKINAEGTEYKTFSETLAKTAKEAKEAARKVKITFTENKYGKDAENICFADDGPKAEEREPGAEG
jgi:hypothetical protein